MKLRKIFVAALLVLALFTAAACSGGGFAPLSDEVTGTLSTKSVSNTNIFGSESYVQIEENNVIDTEQLNRSYFSIDVNTASYPNIRKKITSGESIHPDAVRIEEMLNYFRYNYEKPTDGKPFAQSASLTDCPWNDGTKLLSVNIAAQDVDYGQMQNNLVFLLDVSGSMSSSDKLPLVQKAIVMLAGAINDNDRISVVTYAGSSEIKLDGVSGKDRAEIVDVVNSLFASGSTAGARGIQTAYDLAQKHFIRGGNNRVILCTDGDFNVGVSDNKGLVNLISEKRDSGVYLSIIGVGSGNLRSDKMEELSLAGNGTWAYCDSETEAKRMLVEQIGGSLVTVAKDVKAAVVFNTDLVKSYRQIGYENKQLTQEEYENNQTDAGEIGAGFTLTALYEITLTAEGEAALGNSAKNFASIEMKYKRPDQSTQDVSSTLALDVSGADYMAVPSYDAAFISCVAEFGLVLRGSQFKGTGSLSQVLGRLNSMDLSQDAEKAEFRQLVSTLAQSVR